MAWCAGQSYQQSPTSAVVDLFHADTGEPAGQILLDTTIPGSVFLDWISGQGGRRLPSARYIIRTTGGRAGMGASAGTETQSVGTKSP